MVAFNLCADSVKGQRKDLSDPSSDSSKRACCPARSLCGCYKRRKAGVTECGGRGGQRRGGRRSEGQPVRARANRSALCQRPITSRLARQICPALPGGAAGSPGAAGSLLSAFWKPQGRGSSAEEPEEGDQAGPAYLPTQWHS